MKDTTDHRTRDALGKAQTTAERQARYRARREARGDERVQVWLSLQDARALGRLSYYLPECTDEGALLVALHYAAERAADDPLTVGQALARIRDRNIEAEADEEKEER